jgi:hypothetical protein
MSTILDFDNLEEDVQLVFLTQAYNQLYNDGQIPYGVSTGDDDIWSQYQPVIDLAIKNYITTLED